MPIHFAHFVIFCCWFFYGRDVGVFNISEQRSYLLQIFPSRLWLIFSFSWQCLSMTFCFYLVQNTILFLLWFLYFNCMLLISKYLPPCISNLFLISSVMVKITSSVLFNTFELFNPLRLIFFIIIIKSTLHTSKQVHSTVVQWSMHFLK